MDKDTLVPIFFVVCFAILFKIISNRGRKNKKDFYDFCGGKDHLKYEDLSTYSASGIGIDVNTGTLFLKVGKNQKAYPFSAIRDWKVELNYSNQGKIRGSYLSIHVKDVDFPEWKMEGIVGKRWVEILNQEINGS